MIRTFRSGPLGLAKDQPLPSRLVVMPWGDNEINGGEVLRVNATTLRELPLNQKRVNFDRVALDFNHNSVEGTPFYQGEPAKVAAFASVAVIEGEGIVYENIQYTPEGEEALRNGHYIDLSPAVKNNAAGEVIFLHSCAACRQGQVRGLSILAADPFEPAAAGQTQPDTDTMDYKKLLTAILGLSADASEDEIKGAAEGLDLKTMASTLTEQAETIKTLSAEIKDLGKPGEDDPDKNKDKVVPFNPAEDATIQALSAKVEDLEKRDIERERTHILSAALSEGKIVPASAKDLSIDQLRTLCSELPADQVPLERRTPEHIKLLSASANRADSGEEAVRKALNISEDDWKKFNN